MLTHLKQGRRFYKGVLLLMLPIMLQNLVTHTLALADTFMVGLLGEAELAAMTMATTPFFVLQLLSFGVQSGATVLVAQYHGLGDKRTINRVLGIGLYVIIILTSLAGITMSLLPEQTMSLLTNNRELIPLGAEYMRVIGYSYIFSGISGLYIAVQRSMGNAKLGAIVLGCSGALNVFLNWVLIFGKLGMPALGIAGAAVATLICRILEVAAIVIYSLRDKRLPIEPGLIFRPGAVIARDFMKYALPVVLNEALWSLATSMYSVIMGHMPDNTPILAAFTIAGNIERILAVAIFASGTAAAITIGREIGSGNTEEVYGKGVALNFVALVAGLVTSGLMALVINFLARPVLFPLLDLSGEAVDVAAYMLTILAFLIPLRSVTMTNITGVLRGGGDVRFALILDIVPLYVLGVPLAAVVGLVLDMGIFWVYPCMFVDEVLKLFVAIPRLISRKWINNVTRVMK